MEETIKTLPNCEMSSFAKWIAKATEQYFKNPDVQRRFEEWKKQEQQKSSNK